MFRRARSIKALSAVWLQTIGVFCCASANADSLTDELNNILASHPQIQAARKGIASAEEGVKGALAGYLPKVSLTGDYGVDYVDTPSRRTTNPGKPYQDTRETTGVTVTQKLFDGFATPSRVESARLGKSNQEHMLRTVRQAVMYEGTAAYLEVLRQASLVELSRINEKNIQNQLNLEDERVRRGSGITVDVLQAKSRLQIAKERRVSYEGSLQDAVSRFTQVYNHAPDIGGMVEPPPPVSMLPSSVEEAIEIALKENPALASGDTAAKAAQEKRNAARAEYFPRVDLVGKANYENDKNAVPGARKDWSVLVQANWDLFSGFSTRAAVAAAAFEHAAARDTLTHTGRKIAEQIKISWQALMTARARLELLENAVNIATEVFTSRKKLREAGKETVINVLDAENEIHNARIQYVVASYDARLAIYQLVLGMGRLEIDNLTEVAMKTPPPPTPAVLQDKPAEKKSEQKPASEEEPPLPSSAPATPVQRGG